MNLKSIEWTGVALRVLDQRLLPHQQVWIECKSAADVADAIVHMLVRGAPAIGAAAAYGIVLEAKRSEPYPIPRFFQHMEETLRMLGDTRPTAINLFWAITKMKHVLDASKGVSDTKILADLLEDQATDMASQDIRTNRLIGSHGAALFTRSVRILTHCNTGSLATVEYGTALGVIRSLHEENKIEVVWVDETRPYLQGARLTTYELAQEGIPYRLITDNMAGHFMSRKLVDAVIVGADRIAANGDTANKIGTYSLAVLCQYHQIPFYVAAPVSSFDLSIESGEEIPIEERSPEEVTTWFGRPVAPVAAPASNPAFDVTPADLITAIITEAGVIEHPSKESIHRKLGGAGI